MGKKFASENAIKKVMDLSMKLFPNNEITFNEVNDMWNEINGPIGGSEEELAKWNYTLDDTNNTITLNQYMNTTDTDVVVYSSYNKDGKTYKTKIGSNKESFEKYMFGINEDEQENDVSYINITFNPGVDSSECTDMSYMFCGCSELTTINGLENLDTSNVTTMKYTFKGCDKLNNINKGIESWNIKNVRDLSNLFLYCESLTSFDLTSWDTSNVIDMSYMFSDCSKLTEIKGIENWNVSKVTNMRDIFNYCESLSSINLTGWDISNVTNMSELFSNCSSLTEVKGIENWDTSNVTDMSRMINGCPITFLDLSKWITSNVTDMSYMFCECSELTTINGLENLDTSKVTNMRDIFDGCIFKSFDLSNWNTSNVTDMSGMFYNCSNLVSIEGLNNLDTSNVTTMHSIFYGCSSLTEIGGITNWNITNLTCTDHMFDGCINITSLNLTGWDTSKVISNLYMFKDCSSLKEIKVSRNNWTIKDSWMFEGCGCSEVTYVD